MKKETTPVSNQPVTRRYNRHGKRRGKYAYAAPLGMLISTLALVGALALVFSGISAVRKVTDTTTNMGETMYYFLEPLLHYNPTPFEDITQTEQDAFLKAATYRVSLAEQNRMLKEADENCRYPVDDSGRIVVPVKEIEESYNALFGSASPLTHRSLEEENLLFSDADDCYYVPFQSLNSGYKPVIDYIKQRGTTFTVRIGFVANKDIKIDDHGNEITPTADMATYYQTYTVIQYPGGYYVNACKDD
ncbi:MAG: hypothetical protein II363_04835 [Clostridia bacterium]|nr:hypothetical protein [Loktanella sp.]MBQ1950899.1 hypothetical protein [Clostridia bacterium]